MYLEYMQTATTPNDPKETNDMTNLTPHPITIVRDGLPGITVPPSGTVARVATHTKQVDVVDGIPVYHVAYGQVVGLPETDGPLIVSGLVRAARPDDSRLVSPHDLVRDDQGRVVGCRGLAR